MMARMPVDSVDSATAQGSHVRSLGASVWGTVTRPWQGIGSAAVSEMSKMSGLQMLGQASSSAPPAPPPPPNLSKLKELEKRHPKETRMIPKVRRRV